LTNQETGDAPRPPTAQSQPNRVTRCVQKIERYFHNRRAAKKQENSQDRASRRTANATVWIAALTFAVVLIGGLQYLIFKGQLKVMADQLVEMKGTGTQTDTLIETNKQLANAAVENAAAATKSVGLLQNQLSIMQGQLDQMKSSGKQADNLIEANKKLADAAQIGNRAWISPRYTSINGPIVDSQPLNIRILYDNPGKTPAINVDFHYAPKAFMSKDGNPVPVGDYRAARLGKNVACDSAVVTFAGVVYPASNQANYYTDITVGDADLMAKIKARTAVIAIQGCFVYTTLEGRHKSAFCTYLEPIADKPPEQWPFRDCGDGHEAD
jgi:hypothetical protein